MAKRIISLILSLGIWNTLDAMKQELFQPEIIEDAIIKPHAVINHEVIVLGRCLINSDVTFANKGHIVIYPESTLKLKGYPHAINLWNLKKNSIIFADPTSWLIISKMGKVTLNFIEKTKFETGTLHVCADATLRMVSPWHDLRSFFSGTFKCEIDPGARIFCNPPPPQKHYRKSS